MDLDSAVQFVKSRRDCAEPIPAFIEQLKTYEKQCLKQGLIEDDCDVSKKKNLKDAKVFTSGDKRKAVSSTDSDDECKKRKKVQGPKRPVIGPSFPPRSSGEKSEKEAVQKQSKAKGEGRKNGNKAVATEMEVADKKKRRIGPLLPSHLS